MIQWLKLHFPIQGVRVQSLVGDLGSHTPHSQKKKKQNIKQEQYCHKFNKEFEKKNGSHQKIFKKW